MKHAFDVLDEVFGTDEFSEGQAINSIATGVDVPSTQAQSIFRSLVASEYVGEV